MDGQEQHRRTGQKRKHPVRKTILIILGILIVGVLAYGTWFFVSAKSAIDSTYKSAGETKKAKTVVSEQKPLNVLLMGTDTGAFGRDYKGRTDTMIIATINPAKKKTTLTSIPRDTMAEAIGTDTFDFERINAAYEKGGSKMALKSISTLINVPLEYYVTINMGGLTKIVTAVGGVDVVVPFTFTYEGIKFTKGKMHLNGKEALAYSRMRYDDPRGDYGRQERQRQVITSAIQAAASTRTLTNFQSVLQSISSNMVTNLSFDDMVSIFKDYRGYAENMSSDHLQGVSAMWGEAMIQVAPTAELQRVSDKLREENGLPKETISNQETRQNQLNIKNNNFDFNSSNDRQQYIVYSSKSDTTPWDGSDN